MATDLISPCAPCNAKRDPFTGFHVLVWNRARPVEPNSLFPRYPLSLAVSTDQTRTWKHVLDIETGPAEDAATDPRAIEYIYASIAFTEEAVVVSYGVYTTEGGKEVSRTETATIARGKAGLK